MENLNLVKIFLESFLLQEGPIFVTPENTIRPLEADTLPLDKFANPSL